MDPVIKADELDGTGKIISPTDSDIPIRPTLRRENSAPAPPQQLPPPTPQEEPNPTDSLSLVQLRRLVSDLPKLETTNYAYTYEDTRTFPEELEEWFQYTEEDEYMLMSGKKAFGDKWQRFTSSGLSWTEIAQAQREEFITEQLREFPALNTVDRVRTLQAITYLALGVWNETAGLEDTSLKSLDGRFDPPNERYRNSSQQVRWIRDAAETLAKCGAAQQLFDIVRTICDNEKSVLAENPFAILTPFSINSSRRALLGTNRVPNPISDDQVMKSAKQQELNTVLTILYVMVESGRQQVMENKGDAIRKAIVTLEPDLLHYVSSLIAKLRWDDTSEIPLTRVLLLLWKSMLLTFGGTKELTDSKHALSKQTEHTDDQGSRVYITASPLDYHIFRQEITSKYPAYNPPPPLVPIELENSSILPPLPTHASRIIIKDGFQAANSPNNKGIGSSIFHQPVHISTPAPSPPPSPAGPGGKGGKKQNYQTNQNFPFLYPPLDATSNAIGGKGNSSLQDLVGKEWTGSDVPASILEAGQLFASRMRMSRSLRQLWNVREEYLRFERGWDETERGESSEFGLGTLNTKQGQSNEEEPINESQSGGKNNPKETDDEGVQRRLDAVESFYRSSLPHLQSIVIILLKIILSNVTVLTGLTNGQNGIPSSFSLPDSDEKEASPRIPRSNRNLAKQLRNLSNGVHVENEHSADQAMEELNTLRLREITSKAIVGILLLLLRWFKLSHILKYEYLAQLLLDSNYIPLALKVFAHQDFDKAVTHKIDRGNLNFFHFCQENSKNPPPPQPAPYTSSSSPSSDEAQPPPIPKTRQNPTSPPLPYPPSSPSPPPPLPSTDDLAYPTSAPPQEPSTAYAPRFFYTTITHLRLLQKITKRKAHRALLLVQYKSSTILRKALKIPQPDLTLYTLKLFKSQVPYCGRKWRQSNMRVITQIYLHCKPELRDEWLTGSDVDGVVEEAVPLEQAGRSLVHWWHLREYRDAMEDCGKEGKASERGNVVGQADRDDFFARELERMGWGVGDLGKVLEEEEVGDESGAGAGVGAAGAGTEWDGVPLQLEGW